MTITPKFVTEREVALIRTAVHESGHSVCAVVLGCQVHHAAIIGDSDSSVGVFGHTEYAHEVPDLLAAAVAFAGPYAEARWEAGGRPYPANVAAALAANGRDAAALHALGSGAWTAAQAAVTPLIERCWPGVMRLAAMLFRSGSVNHDDVCAALGVPASGNQLELARIRRAVPGWFQVENRIALARIGRRSS